MQTRRSRSGALAHCQPWSGFPDCVFEAGGCGGAESGLCMSHDAP